MPIHHTLQQGQHQAEAVAPFPLPTSHPLTLCPLFLPFGDHVICPPLSSLFYFVSTVRVVIVDVCTLSLCSLLSSLTTNIFQSHLPFNWPRKHANTQKKSIALLFLLGWGVIPRTTEKWLVSSLSFPSFSSPPQGLSDDDNGDQVL